jgi:hypothetical protein
VSGFRYMFGLVILVMIVGLILRYGNSSHQLAGDLNGLVSTLTLQTPNVAYHGPGQ